ncbi:MAG TPA: hypothetical protein VMD25_13530 [Acidobacteriaceae bacterium]|nr:hypothetical protein [Acidobacteriaceae bacterium]
MKRIIATASLAVASLLTAGNASAQNTAVQATIPFYFVVGSTVLPSGTYVITAISDSPKILLIRNKDQWKFATIVTTQAGTEAGAGDGELVFNRYGDDYFLNEVLCPYAAITAELPTSKMEYRARTREASLEQPEQVLLALK